MVNDKTRPYAEAEADHTGGALVVIYGRPYGGAPNIVSRISAEQARDLADELLFAANQVEARLTTVLCVKG